MGNEVVVIVKVVPLVVDVDSATGAVSVDDRMRGCSPADHAAVAVGELLARHHDVPVRVVSVGTARDAAVLAHLAARIGCPVSLLASSDECEGPSRLASATVAHLLAAECADALYVIGGDHSLDRGSGSVPGRVAEALGRPQALGLLSVDATSGVGVRRLAAGRRERVRLTTPMVMSVEAGAGRPARAAPDALLTDRVTVTRVEASVGAPPRFAPFRVPAAVLAAPPEPVAARRAMDVIGALTPRRSRDVLVAEPVGAARAILDRLHEWGYR